MKAFGITLTLVFMFLATCLSFGQSSTVYDKPALLYEIDTSCLDSINADNDETLYHTDYNAMSQNEANSLQNSVSSMPLYNLLMELLHVLAITVSIIGFAAGFLLVFGTVRSDEPNKIASDHITKTYNLVEMLLQIFQKFVDAYKDDNKIDFLEILQIAPTTAMKSPKIIKLATEFWDEFKDLTPTEIHIVKILFKERFDIPDDKTERKIEAVFNWVVTVIPTTAKLYEEMKE